MQNNLEPAHFLVAKDAVVFVVKQQHGQAVSVERVLLSQLKVGSEKRKNRQQDGKGDRTNPAKQNIVFHGVLWPRLAVRSDRRFCTGRCLKKGFAVIESKLTIGTPRSMVNTAKAGFWRSCSELVELSAISI